MHEPDDFRADPDHHEPVVTTDGLPFEQAARDAMQGLSMALGDLLAALPTKIDRAVDVERALELDKKLAWQIFRLARAQSPAEVAKVPAPRSIRRLLSNAKKRRVPGPVLDRVREAFERFESFTLTQAGDREALASMVRSISDDADEREEVRLRRTLFRANAQVWGLRMRQFVRSTIFLPPTGDPGAATGEIMLSAHIDLEQIRPDSHAAIVSWARPSGQIGNTPAGDPAAKLPAPRMEPSFTLHEEFCSRPLPRMVQRPQRRDRHRGRTRARRGRATGGRHPLHEPGPPAGPPGRPGEVRDQQHLLHPGRDRRLRPPRSGRLERPGHRPGRVLRPALPPRARVRSAARPTCCPSA